MRKRMMKETTTPTTGATPTGRRPKTTGEATRTSKMTTEAPATTKKGAMTPTDHETDTPK